MRDDRIEKIKQALIEFCELHRIRLTPNSVEDCDICIQDSETGNILLYADSIDPNGIDEV